MPEPTNPIWPIARALVTLLVLGACLSFGYPSGFDEFKDVRTMLIVGTAAALAEGVKRILA